jgi:hypothetical protein
VLQSGLGDVVNGILNKLPLEPQSERFWTVLFQEAKIYHAPILLLLKVGMGNVILEQITAHAAVREKSNDAAAYYNSVFWAGAVYNVLINWVLNDAKESSKEMAKICMKISKGDAGFGNVPLDNEIKV